jgi:hypothetical protein
LSVALQLWDVSSACLGLPSPSDDQPCSPRPDPTAPPHAAALSTYLFSTQAVLALYDVTDPRSLEALQGALQVSAASGVKSLLG